MSTAQLAAPPNMRAVCP